MNQEPPVIIKRLFCVLLLVFLTTACEKKPVQTVPPVEPPHEHMHAERLIPTPLAQLKEAPLDLSAACKPGARECSILLLYSQKITVLDWKSGQTQDISFPRNFFSPTISRAPSGKIISVNLDVGNRINVTDSQKASIKYLITNNNLSSFVYLDADLNGPFLLDCSKCLIPVATPGVNTFALKDGKFHDFEFLPANELAIIDDQYHLSMGGKGTLITAASEVGNTLFVQLPYIYTSAATFPGQRDALQKFLYQNGQIILESSQSYDGEILDILIADLNQDGKSEMIVTLNSSRGIFLDVLENF
jgi:hypothetical protein